MEDYVLTFAKDRSTGVLGTTGPDGAVQVAPIHYTLDAGATFIFKSRATSDHIACLASDNRAALAIYRHDSSFALKAGVQLKGRVDRIFDPLDMAGCVALYCETFPGAEDNFDDVAVLVQPDAPSTLFRFVAQCYKLVDGWCDRFDRVYRPW